MNLSLVCDNLHYHTLQNVDVQTCGYETDASGQLPAGIFPGGSSGSLAVAFTCRSDV
jgi:hypothetical protein